MVELVAEVRMATPFEQLELLRRAQANWDGYGADAPRPECVDAAAHFLRENSDVRRLPAPYVVPTRVGGVLFAWHDGTHQLEIEIESPERAGFVFLNTQTDESAEGEFDLRRASAVTPSPLRAIIEDLAAAVPV
jgi:hypothetical protein